MPRYEVELSAPLLIGEYEAVDEDHAILAAEQDFQERLIDGTWSVREVEGESEGESDD